MSTEDTLPNNQNENVEPQMPHQAQVASQGNGFGLGALITTGLVSALAGISGSILYFHFYPQTQELPAPIAVVDTVKLAAAIAQMSGEGADTREALTKAGESIARLQAEGYVVLDSRMVVTTPEKYVMEPGDLVPGAPTQGFWGSSYERPNLMLNLGASGAK